MRSGQTVPVYHFRGARIVQPTRIVTGDLVVQDGVVAYVGRERPSPRGAQVIEAAGAYVVPGFVDIHCHGGLGLDLTEGMYEPTSGTFDPSPAGYQQGLPRLMAALAAGGTTRAILATVAASEERLTAALDHLGRYVQSERNGRDGAFLEGAFIEGTFIRHPEYAGAQNPRFFREPSIEHFERLSEAARRTIRYVNVVPDWGEPALVLIRELVRRGVLVGAGHTQATAEVYAEAVAAGLRVAIHFTNGPTGSSFKPFGGGGVLQGVLRAHSVFAELICDGYHIHPAYVRDIIQRKGVDRVIAITDAMFLAGVGDIETFEVGGVRGRVSANRQYLVVERNPTSLFGSVIRMRDAFGRLLSWLTCRMPGIWIEEHQALDLDDALVAVAQMCATNAARVMGRFEPMSERLGQDLSAYYGGVQVGKRADLAVIRLDGGPGRYEIEVVHTLVGGRLMGGPTAASGGAPGPAARSAAVRRLQRRASTG